MTLQLLATETGYTVTEDGKNGLIPITSRTEAKDYIALESIENTREGNSNSGNYDHAGRPGEIGDIKKVRNNKESKE